MGLRSVRGIGMGELAVRLVVAVGKVLGTLGEEVRADVESVVGGVLGQVRLAFGAEAEDRMGIA